MGSQSSKPSKPSVDTNESYKSARNVLERYAESIKQQAENDASGYEKELKGKLEEASFCGAYCELIGVPKYGSTDPCYLDHRWHTNLLHEKVKDRDPCHNRNQKRFDEGQVYECGSGIIKGNGNNRNGGSCAPPRRRHMCDKNLEALTVANTKNSNDLLGNILVTAKYEGDSIVNSYANSGMFNVCTALARSFADIGDIIRGKDLYLGNGDYKEKVSNNLRAIFNKIYENLNDPNVKAHYQKDAPNYYKLREHWWTVNRDQVWKAITCNAPTGADYFRKGSDGTNVFTSQGQCGHYEGAPPTNLDYVPQFLRWFEEWAEEFCRKKKIKLENVKKACRDESSKLYCSHNGYDCTQTIRNKDICIRESKCTDCSTKCKLYELWLEKQENEFKKQTKKYDKEINGNNSLQNNKNNGIDKKYHNEFYKNFREKGYTSLDKFLKLLNEGMYCKNQKPEEEDIDFTKNGDKGIFYRSEYCQVCPYCGLDCGGKTCTAKQEIYPDCVYNGAYEPPNGAETTEITVLYSADQEGDISNKLSEFCNDENNKNSQKWQCYYVSSENNGCKMEKKNANHTPEVKITKFHNFFEMWVTYLLTETITWKDKLKTCMNNTKTADCIHECNKNCVCFDKWVKQKEDEWNSIKKLFTKEKKMPKQYYGNINIYFESFFFHVMKKLNKEAKWNKLMDELRNKIELSKGNEGTKDLQDAIELLLEYLKEKSTICKDNNTNEACDPTVDPTKNPCGKNTKAGSDKVISVKQIAQYYKRLAHEQLEERGSRSALKGDASKGTYRRQGNPRKLKKVCRIAKDHSNRNHKDSRGRHLCTSYLEFLQTIDDSHNSSNAKRVNNSFLGDVLLSAKLDAAEIIKRYKDQNNIRENIEQKDEEAMCRAVRYSFADLGDIIRGKDLWDHKDFKKLERDLVKIFGKIKDELKSKLGDKYIGDEAKSPYKQLRSDWWEANRHQVWKAMQCKTTTKPFSLNIKCGDTSITPLVDYIPQRLRWMTEWAEWYCKEQSRLYGELVEKCNTCGSSNGIVTTEDCKKKCMQCKQKCEAYKSFIEKWKKQWDEQEKKYQELYRKATQNGSDGSKVTADKDADVVDFLSKLRNKNDTNNLFESAAAYVHDTGNLDDCNAQNIFCEKNCDGKVNDKYVFRKYPYDHAKACNCNENVTPRPPALSNGSGSHHHHHHGSGSGLNDIFEAQKIEWHE
uniref:Erythrocyte membrane protein 1 n=2 Tax=Plasmodium falciparum TaxID=5833 RepID=UPI003FA61566